MLKGCNGPFLIKKETFYKTLRTTKKKFVIMKPYNSLLMAIDLLIENNNDQFLSEMRKGYTQWVTLEELAELKPQDKAICDKIDDYFKNKN